MSAARRLLVKKGAAVLAGVIQKSVSINGEPIDITDDQSGGWRVFDSDVGRRSVDISIEGVVLDNLLRAEILAGVTSLLFTDITLEWPNGDTLAGDFFFNSLEESGPENDKLGFSASLQSSGPSILTVAP